MTYSHFREAAKLPARAQSKVLKKAAEQQWTVKDLKEEIDKIQNPPTEGEESPRGENIAQTPEKKQCANNAPAADTRPETASEVSTTGQNDDEESQTTTDEVQDEPQEDPVSDAMDAAFTSALNEIAKYLKSGSLAQVRAIQQKVDAAIACRPELDQLKPNPEPAPAGEQLQFQDDPAQNDAERLQDIKRLLGELDNNKALATRLGPAFRKMGYTLSKGGMNEIPTVEDIVAYAREYAAKTPGWPHAPFDAEGFFNYYDSQGWKKRNGQALTNWKTRVIDWGKSKDQLRGQFVVQQNNTAKETAAKEKTYEDYLDRPWKMRHSWFDKHWAEFSHINESGNIVLEGGYLIKDRDIPAKLLKLMEDKRDAHEAKHGKAVV